MDHRDAAIRNLQGGRHRRRREARVENDDGVVYPVTGESLVARRALNTHVVVSKKAGLACASAVKQVAPDFATIVMSASVAAFLVSGPNPN